MEYKLNSIWFFYFAWLICMARCTLSSKQNQMERNRRCENALRRYRYFDPELKLPHSMLSTHKYKIYSINTLQLPGRLQLFPHPLLNTEHRSELNTKYWILDIEYWILNTEYWIQGWVWPARQGWTRRSSLRASTSWSPLGVKRAPGGWEYIDVWVPCLYTLHQVWDNSSHCPWEISRGPGLPGPSPPTQRRPATCAARHLHLDDLGGEEGGLPSDEGAQSSLQVGVPEIGVER